MRFEVELVVISLQQGISRHVYVFPFSFCLYRSDGQYFSEDVMYCGITITDLERCSQQFILNERLSKIVNIPAVTR